MLYVYIFITKALELCLATVQIRLIIQRKILPLFVLALVDILLWMWATSKYNANLEDRWVWAAYSLGYATGVSLGIWIPDKIERLWPGKTPGKMPDKRSKE